MAEEIKTVEDFKRFFREQQEKTLQEMQEIRRQNGWESAEEFLAELAVLKFDPAKTYPWETK